MATSHLDLLHRVTAAARSAGHDDLADRLTPHLRRVAGGARRVVLVGAPGEGASTLLDAVVGAPVCPAGDTGGTTVPWTVRGGTEVRAVVVGRDGDDEVRRQVPLRGIADLLAPAVTAVEVELPRQVLDGVELVDLPGVGGPGDRDGALARAHVAGADLVWWVLDAAAPLTVDVAHVLAHAASCGVPVHAVLSRTDLHPDARLRRDGLTREPGAGSVERVLAVSARLALVAGRSGDPDVLRESGVPALVAALARVPAPDPVGARTAAAAELGRVAAELRTRAAAELAEVEAADPTLPAAALDAVRDRVDRLRRRSGRWQQVLGDGMADLVADVEHDLRDRLRSIGRDADEVFAERDPGTMWPEVTSWLGLRVAEAVTVNAGWATARADWLAGEVLDVVAEEVRGAEVPAAADLPRTAVTGAVQLLARLAAPGTVDPGRLTAAQKVLVGMRGSYSGILMIGLVTSLAGLPLVNPVSAGAGLLIGGKAYRDDAAHRLARRRSEATGVVRKHLDEVTFQVGKQLRDELRQVQRALRDAVADHVDEVQRAVATQLRVAQETSRRQGLVRDRRLRVLRERCTLVAGLEREVVGLPVRGGPTGVVRAGPGRGAA